MTKHSTPAPKSEFTGKDAEALIATYGRTIDPEKKVRLVAQLKAERDSFERAKPHISGKPRTAPER